MSIADQIQQLAGTFKKDVVSIAFAEVVSVDEGAFTCECQSVSGDAVVNFVNVRLAAEANDGLTVIPQVGSSVIIGYSTRNLPFILMFSDIEKVKTIINNTTVEISDGLIQFNDGSFGGLSKTQELKTQLDKTNSLLSALILIINGSPIPEPGSGAPSALQVALKAAIVGQVLGDFSNIENTLITHGI